MERIVTDSTGLKVPQQLVALTDAAGNIINPAGGSQGVPYADQQLVTGAAVALTAQALKNGLVILASDTNAGKILVGGVGLTNANDGSGNGYALAAGQPISVAASDASQVYVILANGNTSATDFISVIGN